jgi:hypothetical protein
MNSESMLSWFLLITACDLVAGIIIFVGDKLWSYYKDRPLDINCDNCEHAVPLARTPDKKFYLCRACMNAYLSEHAEEFTEEQILKAKRVFRKLKRKRR